LAGKSHSYCKNKNKQQKGMKKRKEGGGEEEIKIDGKKGKY
jgi:hypothetical protein